MAEFPLYKIENINGMDVLVPYFQHIDDSGDAVKTGDDNPLPTKDDLVKNELEEIKSQQAQILNKLNDSINTNVIGSIVVKEWLGQDDILNVGNIYRYGETKGRNNVTPLDFTSMGKTYVRIKNNYNVLIAFYIQVTRKDNSSVYYQPIKGTSIAAGATSEFYLDKEPTVGLVTQIYTSSSNSPTTGSVDILIIGEGN